MCQKHIVLKVVVGFMEKYDYIIAGAGAAGLSLAFYMAQSATLKHKKVLLIDKKSKDTNDRTWCFWQEEKSAFEDVLYKKWGKIYFANHSFQKKIEIEPYSYKMLKGIDFYAYTQRFIKENTNFQWINDEIVSLKSTRNYVEISTKYHQFEATYVFDGLWEQKNLQNKQKGYHYFLQHFKGWVIKTEEAVFDEKTMTYMDFSVPQQAKEVRFAYVLPFNHNEALVEYTLFSENLLPESEYDNHLKKYIEETLHIKKYEILEQEFGVIPMYDAPFRANKGRIVAIGTKAGAAKASTGFAFNRIQIHSQAIVRALEAQKKPPIFSSSFKHQFYDSTLLNVIAHNRMKSEEILGRMFAKHPIRRIFRFLDEKSSVLEDLKIMNSMPWLTFLRAILSNLKNKF
ncbi:MAG: lycopene cyclase family protein [Thermonemataceae bacterium]|nr:lycopene cyclase family protein [Thermonemataceae bacterium]